METKHKLHKKQTSNKNYANILKNLVLCLKKQLKIEKALKTFCYPTKSWKPYKQIVFSKFNFFIIDDSLPELIFFKSLKR